VFKPAGWDALVEKLTAANNHRAGTPGRRRKTTDPERLRPGTSVFISRLNFPEATGGVVFILAVAFEIGVGGCSRCLASGSFPGCGLF
jgi:hypothetical protein